MRFTCDDGGRLQLVAGQLAPAHRVKVGGLAVHPLVVLVLPAVKVDPQEAVHDPGHRGDADEPRLHEVHGLQLHPRAEAVVGDFLTEHREELRGWRRPQGVSS